MTLRNGSEKYYEAKECAERNYDARCAAQSTTEKEFYEQQGKKLADQLRAEYGYNDPEANYIIDRYLR